jgi:hypothetical protein
MIAAMPAFKVPHRSTVATTRSCRARADGIARRVARPPYRLAAAVACAQRLVVHRRAHRVPPNGCAPAQFRHGFTLDPHHGSRCDDSGLQVPVRGVSVASPMRTAPPASVRPPPRAPGAVAVAVADSYATRPYAASVSPSRTVTRLQVSRARAGYTSPIRSRSFASQPTDAAVRHYTSPIRAGPTIRSSQGPLRSTLWQ